MSESVEQIIERLALSPHPEGGFFRETYRSRVEVPTARGPRAASTSIYFLVTPGNFSAFHRIQSDECWHFYAGDALEVIEVGAGGESRVTRLGARLAEGEVPQYVVPAGVWFGSRVAAGPAGYALVGCTVAPGFDMADFELGRRGELLAAFPTARGLILELTREEGLSDGCSTQALCRGPQGRGFSRKTLCLGAPAGPQAARGRGAGGGDGRLHERKIRVPRRAHPRSPPRHPAPLHGIFR